MSKLSIIIPAKNEASAIGNVVSELCSLYPEAEVLIVDDGSEDDTRTQAIHAGAHVIRHPYSKGNGAAVKTGARHAKGEVFVFMDADGQHQPKDVALLLKGIEQGMDMVVGARTRSGQANLGRSIANRSYNRLATWMVGHPIKDLTSGFRAVDARKFKQFLYMLPNGFSYPSTITMAFFHSGYSVEYREIDVLKREGKSHISPLKDAVRFLLIIFKVGTLFSPLKIFAPFSALMFLTGLSYYLWTYIQWERFTNMSALLLSVSVLIFLIGLVSEQVTTLLYSSSQDQCTRKGPQ